MSDFTVERNAALAGAFDSLPGAAGSRSTLGRILGLPLTALNGIARWWRNRQAMELLAGADAFVLRDIGITRGQITDVVRHGRR